MTWIILCEICLAFCVFIFEQNHLCPTLTTDIRHHWIETRQDPERLKHMESPTNYYNFSLFMINTSALPLWSILSSGHKSSL